MLVSSLLVSIADDLNDNENGFLFTTWKESLVVDWILEALQLSFTERKDLFNSLRVLEVDPCTTYQTACDCTSIRRVIGQSTESGRVIKELRKRSATATSWTGRICAPRFNETLSEYAIEGDTNQLWLYPPIAPGKKVYVLIECFVIPSSIDSSFDIPEELVPAVRQWVLYRAKSMDEEMTQLMIQTAELHKQTFWQILNSQKENLDSTPEATND